MMEYQREKLIELLEREGFTKVDEKMLVHPELGAINADMMLRVLKVSFLLTRHRSFQMEMANEVDKINEQG